jgi:hypothetical protein
MVSFRSFRILIYWSSLYGTLDFHSLLVSTTKCKLATLYITHLPFPLRKCFHNPHLCFICAISIWQPFCSRLALALFPNKVCSRILMYVTFASILEVTSTREFNIPQNYSYLCTCATWQNPFDLEHSWCLFCRLLRM